MSVFLPLKYAETAASDVLGTPIYALIWVSGVVITVKVGLLVAGVSEVLPGPLNNYITIGALGLSIALLPLGVDVLQVAFIPINAIFDAGAKIAGAQNGQGGWGIAKTFLEDDLRLATEPIRTLWSVGKDLLHPKDTFGRVKNAVEHPKDAAKNWWSNTKKHFHL